MEEFGPDDEGYWKVEENEDSSNSYECHGKLSRIWRNGVNLGKKMVITGVVVSSAPFVLSSLVALSAIGVAFSVPAGFVFASYACGEKLMNTLLPISNPYEEKETVFCDDGHYMDYRDDVDITGRYEEDEDLEVEEREFEEDVKELEMRIEFVEENNDGFDDHDGTPSCMDELDKRSSNLSEIIEEGYGDNVREYVAEEEQPMNSKPYCEILGGITEVGVEVEVATDFSFMEKEGVLEPRVGEIVEVEYETPEGNEEFEILFVKDLSRDKENKKLTISKEVEPAMDDKGPKIGLKSKKNVEQVTKDISFLQPRNMNEGNGFSGIEPEELRSETTGLIEKLHDEGKVDQKINDNPTKETSAGNELSGIAFVKEMPQMPQKYEKKNLTIPKVVVEPAAAKRGVTSGLKNENNVEQVVEDMTYVQSVDIKKQNGFVAVDEEEKQNEMTKLIEKMRDEQSVGQNRKGSATPEAHAEPRTVSLELMSEDKGTTSLTVIPKGVKLATNDIRDLFDLRSEVNLENTSIEEDEPRTVLENQLVATVKIDDDHTVTEVHQGTSSRKLGNLILPNEDTRETVVKSGFAVLDNRTMTPHQIVDSYNQMLEGEDHSSNNMVEVTKVSADYHEVAIEPTMPVSGLLGDKQSLNNMGELSVNYEIVIGSAVPVSELAENAKDQGTTAGSDKVKQEEEKIWADINAMRTILGYTNTPHLSCAEELKALYDFTGVELPTSSNDSTDLTDINEKLHFLLSIIGVK